MCRGIVCFTKLSNESTNSLLSERSGCLDKIPEDHQCPKDSLCCNQDLCNHVDSPALRSRLNKTLTRQGSTVFSSLFAFLVLQHSCHRIYHVSLHVSLQYNILVRSIFSIMWLEFCSYIRTLLIELNMYFFQWFASRYLTLVHDIVVAKTSDDQRLYFASLHPKGQDGGQTTVHWFPSAIVVAICGFVVLLIIASLAVRWLHPIPPQNTNKFVPRRTSDNGPPLLGSPKVPLV